VVDHLGHARGSRGKVDQHGLAHRTGSRQLVGCAGRGVPLKVRGRFGDLFTEIEKARGDLGAHDGLNGEACTFREGLLNVFQQFRIVHRGEHFYLGDVTAVHQVLLGKLVGSGYADRPYLFQGGHHDPHFGTLF